MSTLKKRIIYGCVLASLAIITSAIFELGFNSIGFGALSVTLVALFATPLFTEDEK